MARLKNKEPKEHLLRRVRKHRVKYITLLPSLITILNGLLGFTAIVVASKGLGFQTEVPSADSQTQIMVFWDSPHIALAGYLILIAMFADMLDGRLARISHNTSSFGGQLDSLCDAISFGVAPAFLMLRVIQYEIESSSFGNQVLLQRFIWLAAAAYVSCAIIRLARFNVENEQNASSHMSFIGLPSPAAAGVIISLIIFHQEKAPDLSIIVYVLPVLSLGMAALMVSRIRYPHILNQYLKGKKPFTHLIKVLVFLGLVIWSMQAALVLIFFIFAASSPAKTLYYKVLRGQEHPPLSALEFSINDSEKGGNAEHPLT